MFTEDRPRWRLPRGPGGPCSLTTRVVNLLYRLATCSSHLTNSYGCHARPHRPRARGRHGRAARPDGGRPARRRPGRADVDISVEEVAYDIPAITTASPALGARHRDDGRRRRAVPDLRQARPVLGTSPVLPDTCLPSSGRWPRPPSRGAPSRASTAPTWPTGCPTDWRCRGRWTSFDLDELSAAIWIEDDRGAAELAWDLDRYRRAAYLLGRLAASPQVAPLADVGGVEWTLTSYAFGRLARRTCCRCSPATRRGSTRCAGAFDDALRDRLLDAAGRAVDAGAEGDALPSAAPATGTPAPTTCSPVPRRGLRPDRLRLLGRGPVGFDLGQLLVGDVQIGRRSAATAARGRRDDHPGVRRRAARRGRATSPRPSYAARTRSCTC